MREVTTTSSTLARWKWSTWPGLLTSTTVRTCGAIASIARHAQDRAHVGVVAGVGRADDRRHRLLDARAPQVLGVGDVAADEVDAAAGRVLLRVVDDDDLGGVLVRPELGDQLARGRVPAADDDVVAVSGCAHALALLEDEVDDEADEGGR